MLLVGCGNPQASDISINQATIYGDIKFVKLVLAAGTDVDAKAAGGWTPLQVAAADDHMEIANTVERCGCECER